MVDVSRRTVQAGRWFFLFALIMISALATPRVAAATTYTWNVDSNGNWDTPTNWSPVGVPNSINDIAVFAVAPTTGPRLISIPAGVTITIGGLQIDDDHSISILAGGVGAKLVMLGPTDEGDTLKTGAATAFISVPVELQGDYFLSVTGGELVFGAIGESGGARAFNKEGTGLARFAGGVDNTYTGVTTVREGVLELAHVSVTEAIMGPLVIGNGSGAAGSAEVRWINVNQVDNASPVTVLSDGLLNMNGVGDNVAAVTVTSGLVQLGPGAGVLNMTSLNITGGTMTSGSAGSLFILNGSLTAISTATETPTINGGGALALNGATRTFTINDGPQDIDLEVDVAITGGALDGIAKGGAGVLRFGGASSNTYAGTTLVNDGRLELAKSAAVTAIAGPLTVGDDLGTPNSAEVRLLSPLSIADASAVIVSSDSLLNINNQTDAVGTLTVNGGTVSLGMGATGSLGVGPVVINGGGTLQTGLAGSLLILGAGVTVNGAATPATIIGLGTVHLNGATRLFTVTDGASPVDLRIDAFIAGTGGEGLTKQGNGVLQLTANNTFTGNINVGNGTVLVNGSQPQTTVAVSAASATIGGTGTVGPINVGAGAIAPGNSPGILSSGEIVIGAGHALRIELNGSTPGSGYDRLNVAGGVFIGSAVLDVTVGFTPTPGAQFLILSNDGTDAIAGTFAGLAEGATFTANGVDLRITYTSGDGNDVVLAAAGPLSYFLAEGATGGFFDEDVLIANANTTDAPVTLTFLMEGGSTIVENRTVPAQSRLTVHVDAIPGLEATSASVQVTSTSGFPLIVERSMFWNPSYYGGHTANAVSEPLTSWVFAEGSQGFFDTYILVANANATATDVTMTFLREADTPVVRTYPMAPFSRLTVYAGDVPELVARSFGVVVESVLPVTAERSMYFGSVPGKFWSGGHNNMGIPAASTQWFHAEGATGGFFNTFILLSNPQTTTANVELRYLLDTGAVVTQNKTIGANQRLTINPAAEGIPQLTDAALSTVVSSDVPIVSERSMYWGGDASPFGEGHNSAGVVTTATKWGLAEGRVGGPQEFLTYILLANPGTTAADVTITYLRESGTPVVKTYNVPPTSRFNVDVRSVVPEILNGEFFGAKIEVTNGVPIAVERSLYWNANGVFWAGGTNALATQIP